ncbi:phage tail tape measure protein [Acidiphilium iwatense]|uniref:Uncharacterized protein n=1 Tax=Acidiphilium iwatense TaxID=768198 RepID=A0ABS9E049_9PROT|nr:hypothetical protein [Acidiphilium iwatense]MCF3947765.1 hypothetical protein [Acidiphilium iwatense]
MDVYKIGVSLTLRNGVSAGLRLLRHDLGGVMKALDKAKNGTGAMATNFIKMGAAATTAGVAILGVYDKLATAGAAFVHQQTLALEMAVRHATQAKLTGQAWRTAYAIPGTSVAGNYRRGLEARSAVGGSRAVALNPTMGAAHVVMAVAGYHGEKATNYLMKSIELLGATVARKTGKFSVPQTQKAFTQALSAMLLTGFRFNPNELFAMLKRSSTYARMMTPGAFFRSMMTPAQEMGGAAAGTALTSLMMQLMGGRMSKAVADNLAHIGILTAGSYKAIGGGYVEIRNPLKDVKGLPLLAKRGAADWTHDVLRPALLAHGYKSQMEQMVELSRITSGRTQARLLATYLTMWPQYLKDVAQKRRIDALGLMGVLRFVEKHDPYAAQRGVSKAWGNFTTALGVAATKTLVPVLHDLTRGLNHLSQWANAHPHTVRKIDTALVDVGAGLATFGAVLAGAGLTMLVGPEGLLVGLASSIFAVHTALNQNWVAPAKGIKTATGGLKALFAEIERIAKFLGHADAILNGINKNVSGAGKWGYTHITKPIERLPGAVMRYFDGNGGRRVHHGSAIGGYDTWGPGAPPSAHSSADNGLIPTVNIGNWGEGQRAIKHGLAASLNQNQSSTTGFNGRVSPYGTPAFTGP